MNKLSKKILMYLAIALTLVFIIIITYVLVVFGEQRKIYPFPNLNISQKEGTVVIFSPAGGSGSIVQRIDHSKKQLIFTLAGAETEIQSTYEFPINGLIGYKMCYENIYGLHCFGETK